MTFWLALLGAFCGSVVGVASCALLLDLTKPKATPRNVKIKLEGPR